MNFDFDAMNATTYWVIDGKDGNRQIYKSDDFEAARGEYNSRIGEGYDRLSLVCRDEDGRESTIATEGETIEALIERHGEDAGCVYDTTDHRICIGEDCLTRYLSVYYTPGDFECETWDDVDSAWDESDGGLLEDVSCMRLMDVRDHLASNEQDDTPLTVIA